MAFTETAPLVATLDLKGNFAASLKRNQAALGSFGASIGRAGKGVGQLGAGIARIGAIAGTALVGGLVGAARAAIDFEDAFAGVRKTVDEADLTAAGLSFDALAKQFRTMATEIPIAASEFARIGEAAGALGVKAQDIDDFSKTVALLGVTTNLTTEAAAESLGKIGTILDLTGQEYTDFADILVKLGNTGASTESEIIEITKRFAASGNQAGLSTPQILAYASAIASAGAEPEAAGSSLSRLFGNLITDTANATSQGKAFAKVTGKSFQDFSEIVKNDTNGAMQLFLDSLKELDKFGQQQALEAVGITNVRDRNAILLLAETYDKNLVPALRNAETATGSLGKEAQERFNTIASKLTLLKNNFVEAGITIGEGFLPALGRATDKLIAFLKVDANKSALKDIGTQIGKALDSINWDAVLSAGKQFVSVMEGALSFAKLLYDAFSALPGPIKEATAGFLVLNKLSGGLLGAGAGNIIGGLGAAIAKAGAAKLPVVGSLFAQPVFVTNWAMMAGGGLAGLGATAGAGLISKIIGLIPAVTVASLIVGLAVPIGEAFASALPDWLKGPNGAGESESERRIREGREAEAGQGKTEHRGRNVSSGLAIPGVLAGLDGAKSPAVSSGLAIPGVLGAVNAPELEAIMKRGIAAGFHPSQAAAERTFAKNEAHLTGLRAALLTAGQQAAFAIRDSEPAPIKLPETNVAVTVNVTAAQVNKSVVIHKRYGPTGGSRDRLMID